MPAITNSQWRAIREIWEKDPRPGYSWLKQECGVQIDHSTIGKRARKEGWKKRIKPSDNNNLDMFEGEKDNSEETLPQGPANEGAECDVEGQEGAPDSGTRGRPKKRKRGGARPFSKDDGSGSGDGHGGGGGHDGATASNRKNEWSQSHEIDIVREPFGRPKEYKNEYAKQAFKLCLLGATDEDLADFFETSCNTINNWKRLHPDFFQSVRRGKREADAEVAASLFQRAIGLSIPKTHVVSYQGHVKLIDMHEHIPGDVGAQRTWLFNRAPDRWRAEPEPPAPPSANLFPSDEQQEALFAQSKEVTRQRAQAARERRERMGLFDGSKAVPVDAKLSQLRARVQGDGEPGDEGGEYSPFSDDEVLD